MIKIVSFDLDGTLMKSKYADLVWLEGLPNIYSQDKNISFKEAKDFLISEYDKIGNSREEWYDLKYWFDFLNLKYDYQMLLDKYKYEIEIYPEVLTVLRTLIIDYDLIIASNAKREFIDIELNKTKISKFFSNIFSSTSDFHTVNKLTDFYLMICKNLSIEPTEMIHIGDNMRFDYDIPKKIGINSIYLDREKKVKGDFVVNNLFEFVDKIDFFEHI